MYSEESGEYVEIRLFFIERVLGELDGVLWYLWFLSLEEEQ